MTRFLGATALAALLTSPVLADDAALVIGIARYEQLEAVRSGGDAIPAESKLTALGFTTIALPNARMASATRALAEFTTAAPDAERLLVALSGHFVTDGERTWLLTAEAVSPGLMNVGQQGISVESLLEVLAARPGQAVLMLGAMTGDEAYDAWLREGLGALEMPQGVTLITGTPAAVGAFMSGPALTPRGDLIDLARQQRNLALEGYVPPSLTFMPLRPTTPPTIAGPSQAERAAEEALWQGALALDSAEAYRNYLTRYPRGAHAGGAESKIEAILSEPNRPARLAEDAIALTRDQRRDIQQDLTLLGYNTRGIDGIFGRGSRSAITNWQQQNGYPQTSYLTPEEITRLDAQAARRSAELEADARRQAAEAARQDNAFWEETGGRGDEPGYRAYLEHYPDGIHAEQATAQLDRIEAAKRAAAQAEERAAWDRARQADTANAYSSYLSAYPSGAFQSEAEARLAALAEAQGQQGAVAAAQAGEAALNLNPFSLRLVEQRLDRLELEPGQVDGTFTPATRRALRRFQRDRSLEVTGYLNEETVVRLLAGALSGE